MGKSGTRIGLISGYIYFCSHPSGRGNQLWVSRDEGLHPPFFWDHVGVASGGVGMEGRGLGVIEEGLAPAVLDYSHLIDV